MSAAGPIQPISPDETDAKVSSYVLLAFVWFLAGMGIWMALGYMFIGYWQDPQYKFDTNSLQLFISMALMFIIFGLISLIFGILSLVLVKGAIKDDRYDAAYNKALLMGFIGLFFGLGAGLMLVLAAKKFLKNHPKYLATLPVPTPICERCGQPVTFDKEEGGWYCPTCKIHLTKGAPKPKAISKPILPPTPPPKPRPKPGYGPPKPGYGPPKPGYGPQKPMYGAPKPGYGPPKPGYGPPKPGYGPPGTHHGMPPPKGAPGPQGPGHHAPMGPKPMGPPGAPPPKPMGPAGVPPPKPMGPPGAPAMRNLQCGHCGKNFQWNMADPSVTVAKCPWCNNQVPL